MKKLEEAKAYLSKCEYLSDFEVMVIHDMWEAGFYYPYISVDEVKAFWARKGIE